MLSAKMQTLKPALAQAITRFIDTISPPPSPPELPTTNRDLVKAAFFPLSEVVVKKSPQVSPAAAPKIAQSPHGYPAELS